MPWTASAHQKCSCIWLQDTLQTFALDCISSPEVQLHMAAGHPADLCLRLHQLTRSAAACGCSFVSWTASAYQKYSCICVKDAPVKHVPKDQLHNSSGHPCQTNAFDCISSPELQLNEFRTLLSNLCHGLHQLTKSTAAYEFRSGQPCQTSALDCISSPEVQRI